MREAVPRLTAVLSSAVETFLLCEDASMSMELHEYSLPNTLILWDVDHTLIENGGVSKETYALAFELLVGSAPGVRPVTHGRTDFQIMRELLEANSIDVAQYQEISDFESVLVSAMQKKSPELPVRGYVLPGVIDILDALDNFPSVVQSVLTGNISENADSKLRAFDLTKWLDLEVGGYGSDDKVRSNLVGAARDKVLRRYGMTFDRTSTILVGDTPLDIQAAHDGGAKVIAVATGVHGFDELAECRPDATVENLADFDSFLTTLVAVREA